MSRTTLDTAAFGQTSNTRLSLSLVRLSKRLLLSFLLAFAVRTPKCTHFGLGSSAFDRLYLRNRFYFLFLRLLRCFSSPGSPRTPMNSVHGDRIAPAGFPHSDIHGSMDICSSPWLFAAYHVFLRLLVPRHPPCALSCFIKSNLNSDSFV